MLVSSDQGHSPEMVRMVQLARDKKIEIFIEEEEEGGG